MLDLININSCFSAPSQPVSSAAGLQLHAGAKQLQQHQQQVEQAQKQVAGLQSHPAGSRGDQHLQPYSPLNLARVKVEKSPAVQDYNQHQAYNWLSYGQGLYGNDLKSRGQSIAVGNPYQNYSSQHWLQGGGAVAGQLNNYLDVDLSNYHNAFYQQPSQPAVAEQVSDGLQQLIKLQQQAIKKEPLQQQQQPSISSQYAAQVALLEQQQQQQHQQQMLQMQIESQQQFVLVPGLTSAQSAAGLEEEDAKPLSKWKTKTNKSRTTCVVCSAKATGWHYNVQACEGCKAFFKRSVTIKKLYKTCTVRFQEQQFNE